MSARLRTLVVVLCALVLVSGAATPAYSSSESMRTMMAGADPVSVTVDVLLLVAASVSFGGFNWSGPILELVLMVVGGCLAVAARIVLQRIARLEE